MKEYEIGYEISMEEYADVAAYCNSVGNRTIEMKDGKYVVAEIVVSEEEIAASKRMERDAKLNSVTWRLERYNEQKQLEIETTDSAETYKLLLQYRQYLRNIPEEVDFPHVDILTFDDWAKENYPDYVPTQEETVEEDDSEAEE